MLLFLCLLSLSLSLSAEVEGDDGGYHDHNIIGGDVASEAENSKDGNYHHGHDGLDLNEICNVFQNFHNITSSVFGLMEFFQNRHTAFQVVDLLLHHRHSQCEVIMLTHFPC